MCREASKCHRKSFAMLGEIHFLSIIWLLWLLYALSPLRHRDGGINFIWNNFIRRRRRSVVCGDETSNFIIILAKWLDRWSSSHCRTAAGAGAASMSSNCSPVSPGHRQVADTPKHSIIFINELHSLLHHSLLMPGSGSARNSPKKLRFSANCYNPRHVYESHSIVWRCARSTNLSPKEAKLRSHKNVYLIWIVAKTKENGNWSANFFWWMSYLRARGWKPSGDDWVKVLGDSSIEFFELF